MTGPSKKKSFKMIYLEKPFRKEWDFMPTISTADDVFLEFADFKFFQAAIMDQVGIAWADAKKDLMQSRLRNRLHDLMLAGYRDYRLYLHSLPMSHSEWQIFINLLTTNKTGFFREPSHFDFFANAYPSFKDGP
ncbi:MAG: hypothetical protein EOP04_31810 [Proteobacteria bacterium]|nr:MAG: hypothetical protein EOP04_31810 [Pseudomonadota bacterium]